MSRVTHRGALVCHDARNMNRKVGTVDRAYSVVSVKAVDQRRRRFVGTATVPALDRVNDRIDPLGATFVNPLSLLHQHDSRSPIGTAILKQPTAEGITFEAEIPILEEPGPVKERCDGAWQEIKAGLIRAVSIGFRPLEAPKRNAAGGYDFGRIEIVELSTVSVPANVAARITATKTFSAEDIALLKGLADAPARPRRSILTDEDRREMAEMARTFSPIEIAAGETARRARAPAGRHSGDRGRPAGLTLSERAEIARTKTLAERMGIAPATAIHVKEPPVTTIVRAPVDRRGDIPAIARALAAARITGEHPASVAKEWRLPDRVIQLVERAAVGGLASGDGWDEARAGFVASLAPMSILAAARQGGTLVVPSRAIFGILTATASAQAVAEGHATPVSRVGVEPNALVPSTVAGLVVVTRQVLRMQGASDAIDAELRRAVALAADAELWARVLDTGTASLTSTGDPAADIAALVAAVNPAGTARIILAMAPDVAARALAVNDGRGRMTASGGTFFGLPVVVNAAVPAGTMRAVDATGLAGDVNEVEVTSADGASIQMLDDPTGTSVGADPTETPLVSMFQTNSVAIRAALTFAVERLRADAVAEVTGIAWNEITG